MDDNPENLLMTALLLIAHGSRSADANADLLYLAEQLRGDNPIVVASYLELAPPTIDDGARECVARGASRVVMLPYFLSAGVHVRRDLTEARDRLVAEFPRVEFRLAEPLGRHPLLLEVVRARVGDAVQSPSPSA
jgi:sirohydrochlorin ferrochelatase